MAKKQLRVRRLSGHPHTTCTAHTHLLTSCFFVQGKAGNVAKYITRTRAVKRLQLRLAEFRCTPMLSA